MGDEFQCDRCGELNEGDPHANWDWWKSSRGMEGAAVCVSCHNHMKNAWNGENNDD